VAYLSVTKTMVYMGLDDPRFVMREGFSKIAALRYAAALGGAVARVGRIGRDALAHDVCAAYRQVAGVS
jgi:hypothetical protein